MDPEKINLSQSTSLALAASHALISNQILTSVISTYQWSSTNSGWRWIDLFHTSNVAKAEEFIHSFSVSLDYYRLSALYLQPPALRDGVIDCTVDHGNTRYIEVEFSSIALQSIRLVFELYRYSSVDDDEENILIPKYDPESGYPYGPWSVTRIFCKTHPDPKFTNRIVLSPNPAEIGELIDGTSDDFTPKANAWGFCLGFLKSFLLCLGDIRVSETMNTPSLSLLCLLLVNTFSLSFMKNYFFIFFYYDFDYQYFNFWIGGYYCHIFHSRCACRRIFDGDGGSSGGDIEFYKNFLNYSTEKTFFYPSSRRTLPRYTFRDHF